MLFSNFTSLLSLQSFFTFTNTTDRKLESDIQLINDMAFSDSLLSSLTKAKLTPGALVPEGFKPSTELKISFAGKDVKEGNYLKTGETKEAPTVSFEVEVCYVYLTGWRVS